MGPRVSTDGSSRWSRFLTILEHVTKLFTTRWQQVFFKVRLFDSENRDITDQLEYCGNPSCLGEPWCSAFGIWNQLSPYQNRQRDTHCTLNY